MSGKFSPENRNEGDTAPLALVPLAAQEIVRSAFEGGTGPRTRRGPSLGAGAGAL